MHKQNKPGTAEFCAISVFALVLFLPYRAIQYDINGIQEAQYVEAGELFQKNHMLYRPIAYAVYSAVRTVGYAGNALGLLQVLNAIFGAVGVGLCYALCESIIEDRLAALVGAFWLATSFTYWYFSTDAGYIMLAGVFVLGGMICAVRGRVLPTAVSMTLAVLTWQANIFAIPVISTLTGGREFGFRISDFGFSNRRSGESRNSEIRNPNAEFLARVTLTITTILVIVSVFVVIALLQGYATPTSMLHWVSTYGEGSAPLPLWGTWAWNRIPAAAVSALRSIIPILLAARPTEFTQHIQLGRIAVDIALIAFIALLALAALRADRKAMVFLAGYILFLPFIIWWDPYEPKWFLVPNIFLAGFLAASLAPWLSHKYMRVVVLGSIIAIAATNFITTIRPRHTNLGSDREMAQCVAQHMTRNDVFISAQWGWSEYLPYLHGISMTSLIGGNDSPGSTYAVTEGRSVYMVDPRTYSQEHVDWLKNNTGLTRDDLLRFAGTPAFTCDGVQLLRVRR